jgi:hypothetical protein
MVPRVVAVLLVAFQKIETRSRYVTQRRSVWFRAHCKLCKEFFRLLDRVAIPTISGSG